MTVRVSFFGGLSVASDDGDAVVPGRGQQALLLRLAVDAGTTVAYRALADDLWPLDPPDDPRAALQSLASRLRRALPPGALASDPGGYRLALSRDQVDITLFQDLVAEARATSDAELARRALALWRGDVWTPREGFDWLVRDLLEDRAHAQRLAAAPPPVAQPEAAVASVPAPIASLVGRERELAAIRERLGTDRLVTLIGPGGAGKTTLAVETARATADAVVVELAPAATGEVWAAIAGAVGRRVRLPESTGAPLSAEERVAQALAGREVAVVLDNCEHVSREAAEAAVALLQMAPGVRVLATSREPLGVVGEAFVDLGPLPAVDADELFARRVRSARGTPPAPDEAATARRIVQRLDGLPLAIELAAARARTLDLAEIDAGLDDRFALLSNGPRLSSERHRTLRALIDWSWDTLATPERVALRAAAVFPDGVDGADATAVGAGFGIEAAAFDALVDRSLLVRRDGRFRMLETVREYGLDRLRTDGDLREYRERAASVLTDLAARRDAVMRGPRLRECLAWFDANEENLTAALRTRTEAGDRRAGARLLRSLLWAWAVRERGDDLRRGIADLTDHDAPLDDEPSVVIEALALFAAAFPEGWHDVRMTSAQFAARRTEVSEAAERHPSEMTALVGPLLRVAQRLVDAGEGDRDTAHTWRVDVTEAELAAAPTWSRAVLHALRAGAAQNAGDTAELGIESERALATFGAVGDPWGVGFSSQLRSEWLVLEGRLEEALAVIDTSAEAVDGLTSASDRLQQRAQGVGVLLRLGRIDEARDRARQMQTAAETDGSARALAQVWMASAQIEVAARDGAAALGYVDLIAFDDLPRLPDQIHAWSDARRAEALLLLGRLGDARDALTRAIPLAVRSRDHPVLAGVLLATAGWLAATGRSATAVDVLTVAAAIRGADDERDPFHMWVRERLRAGVEDLSTPAHGIRPSIDPTDATGLLALLD